MRNVTFITLLLLCVSAQGQVQPAQQPHQPGQVPIYRVTVIGRTIKAINYGHRTLPTKIDFQGTVLEPYSKGKAKVESKRGATKIEAEFEKLPPPTKYGREYLTYVLWAITPEGRPQNLGEIVLDADNEGKLKVTTEYQAFGMMVTAEPYYSVIQPSDVVVMENVVRGDTVGKVEEIEARYELLPRGQYTLNARSGEAQSEEKKLSMDRYEAVLELYQAQNAVQIARSEGAGRYANASLRKAEELLQQAQGYQAQKMKPREIVMVARQAAQAAEDARIITLRRLEEERQANEKKIVEEREAQAKAEATAAEQERLEAERKTAAAQQAEAALVTASAGSADLRSRIAQQLNSIFETRYTSRGLSVNLYDDLFDGGGATLRPAAREKLAKISGIVQAHPGLRVEVEGYTNGTNDQPLFSQRAAAVREYLVLQGIPAASITARGLSMRPPAGSPQTRRVELVISGAPVGTAGIPVAQR